MAHQFPWGVFGLLKEVQGNQAIRKYPEVAFSYLGAKGQGLPDGKKLAIRDCLATNMSYERGVLFLLSAFLGHVYVMHASPEPCFRDFSSSDGHPGTIGVYVSKACL